MRTAAKLGPQFRLFPWKMVAGLCLIGMTFLVCHAFRLPSPDPGSLGIVVFCSLLGGLWEGAAVALLWTAYYYWYLSEAGHFGMYTDDNRIRVVVLAATAFAAVCAVVFFERRFATMQAHEPAEQERLRKRLADNENAFRMIVDNSPDAVFVKSEDEWLLVNPAGLRLFGVKGKEELEAGQIDFIHPTKPELLLERRAKVDRGEASGLGEMIFIRPDGREIEIEMTSIPIRYAGKPAVYSIVHEISERKQTQELLRSAEKLSIAGQLAAGIAHEIRNPLTSLKGFLQLMQRSGFAPRPEIYEIMASELDRIEAIVSELLVLAKPKEMNVSVGDARRLLEEIAVLLETQAIMNGVQITTHLSEETLPIECDENQVKQVFINFAKNAIEAMPSGGELTVEALRRGEDVTIRFADQGIGMSPEQLAKLGQPFYTTKEKGTGLGLMVSLDIIKRHGGAIEITSREREGTTFTVTFPLHRSAAAI